jgi:hypothetical protein
VLQVASTNTPPSAELTREAFVFFPLAAKTTTTTTTQTRGTNESGTPPPDRAHDVDHTV